MTTTPATMDRTLESHILDFQAWRKKISDTIERYRTWLHDTNTSDALQDLRLYDLSESLKRDHLVLAFVAEFSRGKTETINALFFADYNQRLLPSEPGRTTMSPTEFYWDEREEPCIKLLPIETKKRNDSLTYLKTNPKEWIKIRLDMSSSDSMRDALMALASQKSVSIDEAKALGLWQEDDAKLNQSADDPNKVDIPVWRHAMVNFPHKLLKTGLVLLDTPGLNTIGTEPELTLSIIPNAHAVLFLLATDTGVTKSDMHIWNEYIRRHASAKIAMLNKVDILWDELKSEEENNQRIRSQVAYTAKQLQLPQEHVLAISAQKGLLAKIKNDEALLVKSGILRLEHMIATNVVDSKHQILSNSVVNEVSGMIKQSRELAKRRVENDKVRVRELSNLRGQTQDSIQELLDALTNEKQVYEASIQTFNLGSKELSSVGNKMLKLLNPEDLDKYLAEEQKKIGDSWTTVGLTRGMRDLIKMANGLADRVLEESEPIEQSATKLYELFAKKHGFEYRTPPRVSLEDFMMKMRNLEALTEEFCSNPINIMTEKHFLIRRFYIVMMGQAREIFSETFSKCHLWLKNLLFPLKQQINEHKNLLDQRTQSLRDVHDDINMLEKTLHEAQAHLYLSTEQANQLDSMLLILMKSVKASPIAQEKTMNAPELSMQAPTLQMGT